MVRTLRRLTGAITVLACAAALVPALAAAAPQQRIVGGRPAGAGDYPFYALLRIEYPGNFVARCGGSLISARFILTAAHCLDGPNHEDPTGIEAAVGVTEAPSGPFEYSNLDGVRHPQFGEVPSPGGGNHLLNDVAIIGPLPTPAPEAQLRLPRPADSSIYPAGTIATGIGFGATGPGDAPQSDQLLEVELAIVDDFSCGRGYGSVYDASIMLCAGTEAGKDTCPGDSGGPLLAPDGDRFLLAGAVSYGPECGSGIPAIYADVGNEPLNTWIRQRVPQVEIDVSSAEPEPGQTVTLTAAGGNPFGPYETYAWDLDNDGAFDDASGLTATTPALVRGRNTVGVRATRGPEGSATRDIEERRIDIVARFRSPVSFSPPALRVTEGQPVALSVAKQGSGEGTVTVVPATITAAIGGIDVAASTPTSLSFGAGETSKPISIPTVDDKLDEPDETFKLDLASHTGELIPGTPGQIIVTVVDNDLPPSATATGRSTLKVKRGKVTVPVTVTVAGAVKLKLTDRAGRTLGTAATRSVAAPGTVRISVKLNKRAKKALRRKRKRKLAARVAVTLIPRDVPGPVTTRRNVTLKR